MPANFKNAARIIFFLCVDLLAFYCALVLAFFTRKLAHYLFPGVVIELLFSLRYFIEIWWLPLIFVSFISYARLYTKKLPFWDETKELIKAVTISAIAVLALITLGKMTDEISRLTMILLWFYGLFIFPLSRLLGETVLNKTGLWQENVIIIGAGDAGIAAAKGIIAERHAGYHLIGFLDDADDKIGTGIEINGKRYKIFGKIKHYTKFINILNISTIIIALPSLPVDELTELTNTIQKHAKNILLIPDIKGIALMNTELYHLFAQQLFLFKINNNLKSPSNRFMKRAFDIIVSFVFLPLLLPLIGILGLLIKLDSPGPVLYRHRRIGLGGTPFSVYKFRSMHRDSPERLGKILNSDPSAKTEWETSFKLKNDPRITRMGNFLRKTSLDELPQIFNVLKGEMSFVGPRPVLDEEISMHYKEYADYYHMVRPGITGLWQVSGRNDVDYETRVRLDVWYVLNWSIWLDVLMLLRTIRVVLKREGAY